MKMVMPLSIALLVAVPALAQEGRATAIAPDAAHAQVRDLRLEQAVSTRAATLSTAIQLEAREKLDLAARAVLADLAAGAEDPDPDALARLQLHARFDRLSTRQSDLFSFYVLAGVAALLSNPAELDPAGVGPMSATTSFRLQAMLDRRSRLMSTLSNLMKKTSDTNKSVIQNIK